MKFAIAKEQLLTGLQAVQNIVGSRTTLPILSNVLLSAASGRLELIATDLDVTISCSVDAQIVEPGRSTVPVKKLLGISRELAAPEIDISVDDKAVMTLQAGGSFYRINGLSADDFPPLPTFSQSKAVSLAQDQLKAMLRKTSFAASTDEARYVLNGIFFSFREHKVTLVATDGRRLALADEEADVPQDAHAEFIVPNKAINEVNRLLGTHGAVEIRFSENQVAFRKAGEGELEVLIVSKLVDGNYPNYRQVIPPEPHERIPLPREEFLGALRRAELMTSEKSNSVKLTFSRNQLAITANTPEIGEARETLAIKYQGKDIAIAFNPAYLLDPLKALDEEEVAFELIDDLSPGVLKTARPFLYVIMPMRMS
ncbi:MAG: DNA polymerase III subunit beta [Verrucomicrobiae bacterium]|nr:DNA polymerase III subunit beta [Verrucomicrobiae bacterium]